MSKEKEYDDSFWDSFEDIDDAKATEVSPIFKMQGKGTRARIFFPLVKPSTKKIAMKRVEVFNYSDPTTPNSWARFQAPEDKESKAYEIAVRHCGEPTVVRATPVLVYETNDSGKIISGEDYSICILKITPQRLTALKSLQMEHDLAKIDLIVNLKDEKYQNIEFMASVSSAIREGEITQKDKSGNPKTMKIEIDRKAVIDEALEMLKDCDTAVASRWSEQQIINFFSKSDDRAEYDNEDDEDWGDDEEETKPEKSVSERSKSRERRQETKPEYDNEDDEDWGDD